VGFRVELGVLVYTVHVLMPCINCRFVCEIVAKHRLGYP
jgi:hypothetical protein